MNIYVDIDDVVTETARSLCGLARRMFGRNVPYGDVHAFDLRVSFSLDDAQIAALMDEAHSPAALAAYPETPDACATIASWVARGHSVTFVTGRPASTHGGTVKWLSERGLGALKVLHVDKFGRELGSMFASRDYVVQLDDFFKMRFDFAVEDSPIGIGHLARIPGCRVAVFNRPWNSGSALPGPAFQRADDWPGVNRLFLEAESSFPPCAEAFAPSKWDAGLRESFLSGLGISAMFDPMGGLSFATSHRIPVLELRDARFSPGDLDSLKRGIAEWRGAGGKCLSWHLPALSFDGDGAARGIPALRDSCRTALGLGCDRVTLHVPGIPFDEFEPNRERIRGAYAEALCPLADSGVAIGVENMHITGGECEEKRGFGYIPGECLAQIELLRTIPGLDAGFHLDVGHAANNGRFSAEYPLPRWLGLLGRHCNGLHIHRVGERPGGGLVNHLPVEGLFDGITPLWPLAAALKGGILKAGIPIVVEVRDGLGPASYELLERLVGQ